MYTVEEREKRVRRWETMREELCTQTDVPLCAIQWHTSNHGFVRNEWTFRCCPQHTTWEDVPSPFCAFNNWVQLFCSATLPETWDHALKRHEMIFLANRKKYVLDVYWEIVMLQSVVWLQFFFHTEGLWPQNKPCYRWSHLFHLPDQEELEWKVNLHMMCFLWNEWSSDSGYFLCTKEVAMSIDTSLIQYCQQNFASLMLDLTCWFLQHPEKYDSIYRIMKSQFFFLETYRPIFNLICALQESNQKTPRMRLVLSRLYNEEKRYKKNRTNHKQELKIESDQFPAIG